MGQFFILRSRVQQEYNGLLVNALNRIFNRNLSLNTFKWLLTKVELSCVRNIMSRSRKRLWNGYTVLNQELQNHDAFGRHIPVYAMYGSTPPGVLPAPGGGGTPLYKPYRYVPHPRVGFLCRFGLKTDIHLNYFRLESSMIFKGIGNYESVWTYLSFHSKWVTKKEKYANSKWILRNLFCCCSNLSNNDPIS